MVLGEFHEFNHHLVEVFHPAGDLVEYFPLGREMIQLYVAKLQQNHFVKGLEIVVSSLAVVNHFASVQKLYFIQLP